MFCSLVALSYKDCGRPNVVKYIKCNNKRVGFISSKVFADYTVKRCISNDWVIYMPCDYNGVEKELRELALDVRKPWQKIFGIAGCDQLVSKNNLWNMIKSAYGHEMACSIMPESYILRNPFDMKGFVFNPNEMYILKKNVQRKKGLKLTRSQDDIKVARKEGYAVVQKYMRDVFLVNGRKINLRVYLAFVVYGDLVNVYLHREGKCIYTRKKYNSDDLDFESNITSYHLDVGVYKENPLSVSELKEFLENGGYEASVLFDRIDRVLHYTAKACCRSLKKLPNLSSNICFQLFGVDVIFDGNLNPYVLEMNKGPDMSPKDKRDEEIKYRVIRDTYSLVDAINVPENGYRLIYKGVL